MLCQGIEDICRKKRNMTTDVYSLNGYLSSPASRMVDKFLENNKHERRGGSG